MPKTKEQLLDDKERIDQAKMIFKILDEFGNRIPQDVQDEMRGKANSIIKVI